MTVGGILRSDKALVEADGMIKHTSSLCMYFLTAVQYPIVPVAFYAVGAGEDHYAFPHPQLPTSDFQPHRVTSEIGCAACAAFRPARAGLYVMEAHPRSWNLAKLEVPHTELPLKATLKF